MEKHQGENMSENKNSKKIFDGALCIIASLAIGFHLNSVISDDKSHSAPDAKTPTELAPDSVVKQDSVARFAMTNQKTR